jgi:glycerophosphoryl diester phosphodiesterase
MTYFTTALALALFVQSPAYGFDLQGHRGARGLAPENTLPAFERALTIGVSTLELDLGLSRDNVLVVHHDLRLNADMTRDANGEYVSGVQPTIRSLTLAQLKQYDVGRARPGSRTAQAFPQQQPHDGARIPTLAEVIALTERLGASNVRFNIETKLTPHSPADTADAVTFARAVAEMVQAHGLAARVSVQSFDWRSLTALRTLAPEIARVCLSAQAATFDTIERGRPGASPWTAGLDVDDVAGSVPRLVAQAGCAVWSPQFRDATVETIAEAHRLGLTVSVWTVNEAADIARLIDMRVDGIITDYPDRAREVMAARGMALPARVGRKE